MVEPVVLRVSDLVRRYPGVTAVNHISFEVLRGEIVGLIGRNGAGKTTLINCVLGLVKPSDGTVHVRGINVYERRSEALTHANFAAPYTPLPGHLTVIQNLRFFARLYAVSDSRSRIAAALEQFDLLHLQNRKCGLLSSGEQTRAALAKATLNRPALLLLDEPTASLDPCSAKAFRTLVRKLALQMHFGVLWTSHNMAEVEEVCDRMLLLSAGRIVVAGAPRRLLCEHGVATLEDLFLKLSHS